MPIEQLPIFTYYDKQRFIQFGSADIANWYGVTSETGKKKQALYPSMGRKHINYLAQNRLIFSAEPRAIFRTTNFFYVIDGTAVYQVNLNYDVSTPLGYISNSGEVWFDFLAVGTDILGLLTDESHIYLITETDTGTTMEVVTDPNAPGAGGIGGIPLYVAAFGSRFVISLRDSPQYYLSNVNFNGGTTMGFTINGAPLFNQASGIIRQFGVLHAQLYIFTDYTTDIWANIVTQISLPPDFKVFEFPWKLNSSYNWDYGLADPYSLDIDFGRMVWLAQNKNGLVTFIVSDGQTPQPISTQAINVLLENEADTSSGVSPFIESTADGFLYQYENTIFYRVSAGDYLDTGILDQESSANCLEYNFDTGKWGRAIELNGERNRIQKHIYFNNKHLVTVQGDPAIYEMAGNIYYNELYNQDAEGPQAPNAFLQYPMRYELVTPHIFLEDYAEFSDKYVEIDFVFGNQTFYKSSAPFQNTEFLISESRDMSGAPIYIVEEDDETFMIAEGSNTPTFSDNHYDKLFKPYIALSYSDDGGVSFTDADLREFSPLGQYRWRMRWYELGVSRNRVYKLICVSSAPIVILGAVRDTMRVSGGAN